MQENNSHQELFIRASSILLFTGFDDNEDGHACQGGETEDPFPPQVSDWPPQFSWSSSWRSADAAQGSDRQADGSTRPLLRSIPSAFSWSARRTGGQSDNLWWEWVFGLAALAGVAVFIVIKAGE